MVQQTLSSDITDRSQSPWKRRIRFISLSIKDDILPAAYTHCCNEGQDAENHQRNEHRAEALHDIFLRINSFLGGIGKAFDAKKKPDGKRQSGKDSLNTIGKTIPD